MGFSQTDPGPAYFRRQDANHRLIQSLLLLTFLVTIVSHKRSAKKADRFLVNAIFWLKTKPSVVSFFRFLSANRYTEQPLFFDLIRFIPNRLPLFQFKSFNLISPVADLGIQRFAGEGTDIIITFFYLCTVL